MLKKIYINLYGICSGLLLGSNSFLSPFFVNAAFCRSLKTVTRCTTIQEQQAKRLLIHTHTV